jgi:hypothetical protein
MGNMFASVGITLADIYGSLCKEKLKNRLEKRHEERRRNKGFITIY